MADGLSDDDVWGTSDDDYELTYEEWQALSDEFSEDDFSTMEFHDEWNSGIHGERREYNDGPGPYPFCAFCAGPLASEMIKTAHATSKVYPRLRRHILRRLFPDYDDRKPTKKQRKAAEGKTTGKGKKGRRKARPLSPADYDSDDYDAEAEYWDEACVDPNDDTSPWELYDPRVLRPDHLQWLDRVMALSYRYHDGEPDEQSVETFILDSVHVALVEAPLSFPTIIVDGPNSMGYEGQGLCCYEAYHPAYREIRDNPGPCFPFHFACYGLFQEYLRREYLVENMDLEVLYLAMHECVPKGAYTTSGFDYEKLQEDENRWVCYPGEEHVALDPTSNTEAIIEAIRKRKPWKRLTPAKIPADDPSTDIFSKLPPDLLVQIMDLLTPKEIQALTIASWPVYLKTPGNHFWKTYTLRALPWLQELRGIADRGEDEALDYKDICLWVDMATRLDPRATGRLLPLANRRRVWEAWKAIGRMYGTVAKLVKGLEKDGLLGEEHRDGNWMRKYLDAGGLY